MKREFRFTTRFKKDYKLAQKRGLDLKKIDEVMQALAFGKPLSAKNRDHSLTGNCIDCRECHIEPDWLLVYRLHDAYISFERTGSHSDLFKT